MPVPVSLTCAITGTAAVHASDREFASSSAALVVGQADRLARVHRQRQRVGAVADMEFDELGVKVEVEGALARERRHRRVHEAWLEGGHGLNSIYRSDHQPCGSVSRIPSLASSLWM